MVDRLCTSLGGLSLSAIRRYTALAAEREDCITLTIGEPDLPTPAPHMRGRCPRTCRRQHPLHRKPGQRFAPCETRRL